jgi:hypothetical protein
LDFVLRIFDFRLVRIWAWPTLIGRNTVLEFEVGRQNLLLELEAYLGLKTANASAKNKPTLKKEKLFRLFKRQHNLTIQIFALSFIP